MTRRPPAERVAEYLIRRACRHLPGDIRDERYREWTAELPAILHDPDLGFAPRRWVSAILYAAGAAGAARGTRRPGRAAGGSRPPAPGRERHAVARRLVAGAGIYLGVVAAMAVLYRLISPSGWWPLVPVLAAATGFAAFCLADLARASEVRYLPKWTWAVICLIQVPLGGIIYLSIGRTGGPDCAAPGPPWPVTPR